MNQNNLKDITVFIDESGSIPRLPTNNNYFIITLLFIENENIDHVKKIFRRSRLKIVKRKQHLYNKLKLEGEIKGSELSEKEKTTIYSKIIETCGDKFELGIIVFDSKKANDRLRSNSSRVFNYLIKIYLYKYFKKWSKYNKLNSIKFIIDERNVATQSTYTLKEYLNTELNLIESFSNQDIDVHYYDFKKYLLLQMADFISNTFYRKIQKNQQDYKNSSQLLKQTCKSEKFIFPL